MRALPTAEHEAAHVVVGVTLGLQLLEAVIGGAAADHGWDGAAWFAVERGQRTAWAITIAAGVAWERATGGGADAGDRALLRRMRFSRRDVESLAVAAAAILAGRRAAHAAVTRALLERDIRARDIDAIARGENLHMD